MFEIQVEHYVRDGEINAERVIVRGCQVKLADRNRTQERCIDLVDVNREAFLLGSPPNPPANAMGNGKRRKANCQQRRDQQKQTNEGESTFQRHLDCCRNDKERSLARGYGVPSE
jgi:hypothetical protein